MGKIRPVKQAKLFTGIIVPDEGTLSEAEKLLEEKIGGISLRSEIIPFAHTDYYRDEMGGGLLRRWVGFEKTVLPSELSRVKLATNEMEARFSKGGKRSVNLDPGYLELAKVVLASTKDFGHRICIGDGIYAEITLIYYKGEGYKVLPWTYPDYYCAAAVKFLVALRKQLKDVSMEVVPCTKLK